MKMKTSLKQLNEDQFLTLGQVANQVEESLMNGQIPSIEDLVQKHPDLESQVRELVPTLLALDQLKQSQGAADAPSLHEPAHSSGKLGDYSIIRQIGRGGMGVVYEADQISIGRRVALKVLPFAAVMNEKQIQRFKNEARAAGSLEHSNIVSVFSVGEVDGVHYIAMQLVNGQNLSELIEQLTKNKLERQDNLTKPSHTQQRGRAHNFSDTTTDYGNKPEKDDPRTEVDENERPALATFPTPYPMQAAISTEKSDREFFRTVARLGIQAAQAIDYAHQNGIIHRDIKPGNLMVDTSGTLMVTDFGLARIEDAAAMTMTGDLVGTLRYMSPEQAMSQRTVDHRSDIYSLGATFYELLTLRPLFEAENRKSLLNAILNDEPRGPRRIDPAIPTDLETIVLKATRKRPEERYSNAEEVAEDLRRYLDNRPIKAKRPTVVERLSKWSLRYKAGIATAAGSVAVAWMIASVWIVAERNSAIHHRETALQEARLKEQNLAAAREVVDEFLVEVSESHEMLRGTPGVLALRRRLLVMAKRHYQSILNQSSTDVESQLDMALAQFHLGNINKFLGNNDLAMDQLKIATESLTKHSQHPEQGDRVKHDLARSWHQVGTIHESRGDQDAAVTAYQNAIRLRIELQNTGFDESRNTWNHSMHILNLGNVYANLGRLAEALNSYEQAAELQKGLLDQAHVKPDYQSSYALALNNIANIHSLRGEWSQAEEFVNKAISLGEELCKQHPKWSLYEERLALSHQLRGECLMYGNELYSEAREEFELAREIRSELVQDNPLVTRHLANLADTYNRILVVSMSLGSEKDAEFSFGEASKIHDQLSRKGLKSVRRDLEQCGLRCNYGIFLIGCNKHKQSIPYLSQAEAGLVALLDSNPRMARRYLFVTLFHRAKAYEELTEFEKELGDLDRCLPLASKSSKPALQVRRARSHARLGDHSAALKLVQSLADPPEEDIWRLFDLAGILCESARQAENDDDRSEKANEYRARAVELLRDLHKKNGFDVDSQYDMLKSNPSLNELRIREDFKSLLSDVESNKE